MKKITDFIVNKRKVILVIFIILAGFSVYAATKVNINSDMTRYLPETSKTKIGVDIMEEVFSDSERSSLSVMFSGLEEDKKLLIKQQLEEIKYVDTVNYEEGSNEYNKDEYTLYILTVDYQSDSEEAASVYNTITEKYKNYEIYMSGDIASSNTEVLPMWIVVLAVVCALIILIIMCPSYVEPFLFLFVILLAVVLNSGTNIIFDSVSNITNSIAAILQMALSMDYSIMLMERYNQEKEKEKDTTKAMKNALYHSFQSISSSSLTTIVGLLMLVFMSFTIGRDLGLVLAKGVLLSLVCIFTCLPGLILMFDKQIEKTRKKTPNINLEKLGKISNKLRYVGVFLFAFIFIGSYLLKGNLNYEYTENDKDKIDSVFSKDNQIAIIYKNEYEKEISEYCKELESNENISEVLCYGNTINEELKYDELNEKLESLGSDTKIEDYLLKIIYYNYYNSNVSEKMTFNEFIQFIEDKVYSNPEIADKIDKDMKEDINRLENFTTVSSINQQRNSNEIASIFGLEKSDVDNLMVYYNSKNTNVTLTLKEFINFMNKDVLTNSTYSSSIDANAKANLNTLSRFTDESVINKKMTAEEISSLLRIDKSLVEQLFTYYASINQVDLKLSIKEFSDFLINDVAKNSNYAGMLDENMLNNIRLLASLSDSNVIDKEMTAGELSVLLGIDENTASSILLLKYMNSDNGSKMSIAEFALVTKSLKENTNYLDSVDDSIILQLENLAANVTDNTKYTSTQMAEILNVSNTMTNQIYALNDYMNKNTTDWKMTPYDFIYFILNNNENMSDSLNSDTLQQLNMAKTIMDSSKNNITYTYSEISKIIGIDETTTKNIYILYNSKKNPVTLSPSEFVKFILNHKNDDILLGKIDNNTINNLRLLNDVMDGVNNHTRYTYEQLSNLLGIDDSSLSLLYSLYSSIYINSDMTMSLKTLTQFILDDVVNNETYRNSFDDRQIEELKTMNGIIKATENNTKYSASEIYAIMGNLTDSLDSDLVDIVYLYYGSEYGYNNEWTLTVEKFINYLNNNILADKRFDDFVDQKMRNTIIDSKHTVDEAKELLIDENYSRAIINTTFDVEGEEVYNFIRSIDEDLIKNRDGIYIAGDSSMSYEMNQTFNRELNYITILTMLAIFLVVAITFKSPLIAMILVLIIQCAVYFTMGVLSVTGGNIYFIAVLVVQSILMGATIDYAIVFTSYYLEARETKKVKDAISSSYNNSINTIITSSSILIIDTLIIATMTSGATSKICKTLSLGTFCSAILILLILPTILAAFDKVICRKKVVS